MSSNLKLSEEMSAGPARLRVDVYGSEPLEHVLDDMSFLDYRLADVRIEPEVTLAEPDVVWHQDAAKDISYDGLRMTFSGPWPAGPIQKVVVTMLALRMESVGLHPFHASAVRYRGTTGLCLGAAPNRGVEKFFGTMPSWEIHTAPSNVDVVVVPAIDGNFDPSCAAMIPFERQFQTFHSVQNYFLLNELLAPGFPMPIVDTDALRAVRADFVRRFPERPHFFLRAATPPAGRHPPPPDERDVAAMTSPRSPWPVRSAPTA